MNLKSIIFQLEIQDFFMHLHIDGRVIVAILYIYNICSARIHSHRDLLNSCSRSNRQYVSLSEIQLFQSQRGNCGQN